MILGCGVLVMFAAVSLSMAERLQESAILRTLGSSRLVLGVQWVEFTSLGTDGWSAGGAGSRVNHRHATALYVQYALQLAQLAVVCPAHWGEAHW